MTAPAMDVDALVRRAELAEATVAELHAELRTDGLTGIANRLALREAFTNRTAPVCSVLMIDLDGFKAINDTHGHRIGDLVLLETAHRLHDLALPGELAVRESGDEFIVWLNPSRNFVATAVHAEDRVQTVRAAISQPIWINDDDQIRVTGSVGAAVVTHPTCLEDVLAPADHDMYAHKPNTARRVAA